MPNKRYQTKAKPSQGTTGDPQRHDQLLVCSSGSIEQFRFYHQLESAFSKTLPSDKLSQTKFLEIQTLTRTRTRTQESQEQTKLILLSFVSSILSLT